MYILHEIDNNNRLFKHDRSPKFQYPDLKESIKEIKKFGVPTISKSELKLLKIFNRLNIVRNQLMHQTPPSDINEKLVSFASISLISMTKMIARKKQTSFINIINEISESHDIVFQKIHWKNHDEYFSFMEEFIHEEFKWHKLGICPSCNAYSINGGKCEICFEEVDEIICEKCNEEFYVISHLTIDNECPSCNNKIEKHTNHST